MCSYHPSASKWKQLYSFIGGQAESGRYYPPGDGGGQVQLAAEALSDAPITARGLVTQQLDLLVGAALLLPCLC